MKTTRFTFSLALLLCLTGCQDVKRAQSDRAESVIAPAAPTNIKATPGSIAFGTERKSEGARTNLSSKESLVIQLLKSYQPSYISYRNEQSIMITLKTPMSLATPKMLDANIAQMREKEAAVIEYLQSSGDDAGGWIVAMLDPKFPVKRADIADVVFQIIRTNDRSNARLADKDFGPYEGPSAGTITGIDSQGTPVKQNLNWYRFDRIELGVRDKMIFEFEQDTAEIKAKDVREQPKEIEFVRITSR